MTAVADSDAASGADYGGWGGSVLGFCLWCGRPLSYARPGNPPYDAISDKQEFYAPINIWRDYSLIDIGAEFGKFCPFAPPHPLGQYSIHQLVANSQQP